MSSVARIPEGEPEEVVRELEALSARLAGGLAWNEIEDDVWRAYVRVEILVTKMKLRMNIETPGRFVEPVVRDRMTDHVPVALEAARAGVQCIGEGSPVKALALLRECRNELRTFLDSARKSKMRQMRKMSRERRTRQASSSGPS